MSMLGLRKNPLSRRKRDSTPSSLTSTRSTEDMAPSLSSPAPTGINGNQATEHSDTSDKRSVSFSATRATNDTSTAHRSDKSDLSTTVDGSTISATTTTIEIVQTVESARLTKERLLHELQDITDADFQRIDLQFYLNHIADERLMHMPARGSEWDRVLTAAEYFGMQVDEFASRLSDFVRDSYFVRDTALASCLFLLQLGWEQAEALEPTFNAMYALGILLSRTIRLKDHFKSSDAIAQDVGGLFSSLVELVGEIAVFYRKQILRISGSTSGWHNSVVIDFDARYGDKINDIWYKREQLINRMWKYELRDRKSLPLNIVTLRQELSNNRETVKSQVYGRVAEKKERIEGSCEWIQRDLGEFVTGKEQVFTITGGGGCGKSVLASWMRERLEKHVNFRRFETLSFTFAEDNPAKSTILAFLKSIISQLLEHSVGDVRFFEKLSGIFVGHNGVKNDTKALEAQLWEAVDVALDTRAHDKSKYPRLIIIIDGLDEVVGGHQIVRELHTKLYQVVDKHIRIRAITFSRQISHIGVPGGRRLEISPDHLRDDIEVYLEERLSRLAVYKSQKEHDQKALLGSLKARTNGSFLSACLAVEYLQSGVAFSEAQRKIQAIKGDSTQEILGLLFASLSLDDSDTRKLFSFVLAADRRLSLRELGDLLRVNVAKKSMSDPVDVRRLLQRTRGLIVEQKGFIRFRNSVIRSHVLKHICGTALPSLEESHTALNMSLLLFAKLVLSDKQEPSCDMVESKVVRNTLDSYHILDYFVNHWTTHFKSSTLMNKSGGVAVTSEFKQVFPDTTFTALLEWSCWQTTFGTERAIPMHDLALQVRTACFGEKHRSVLQNLIILGSLYRMQSDTIKAAELFYRASSVGRVVLYKFSPFVVSTANTFLVLSAENSFTERTTIVTYREETIRFIIEVCKAQYGVHSDSVLQWLEVLAKLYLQIHETHHAAAVYRELREITLVRFGHDSPQARSIVQEIVDMSVVLKSDIVDGEIEQLDETLFRVTGEVEHGSDLYFQMTIQRIEYYERTRQLVLAENLYLTLWRNVCDMCHGSDATDLHLRKFNIAMRYARFLLDLKRREDACNIIVCVWADYEHHILESETFVLHFKELAILARSLEMFQTSIVMLRKVWLWFKERDLVDHEEAVSTTLIITEIVEKTVETIVEKKTVVSITETVTKEIWEINCVRCKGGRADDRFLKACIALADLYARLEKWAELEVMLRRTLDIVWKSVLSDDTEVTFEASFLEERLDLALRLGRCLHRLHRFEKTRVTYSRLFRACLEALKPEDVRLMNVATTLTSLYEEYHRYDEAIAIYVVLLDHYRKHLGPRHPSTVNILRKLASSYQLIGRNEAFDCYMEILNIFTESGQYREEGLDAAVIVLNFCHDEHRWTDLEKICTGLWQKLIHSHQDSTFSEEIVQVIYERYRFVLEVHKKVEFNVLYKLTREYRETVSKVFGANSSIFVVALTALAELCEHNEEHQEEGITIYEEIITKSQTSTTVTESKITTIKKRLSRLYVTVVTSGKSKTTTTVDRAIQLCVNIYEKHKLELGLWHETTLAQLRELVILYRNSASKDSSATIVKLMQTTILDTVTTVTESWTLYRVAEILASIYITCGMVHQGRDLLRQLQGRLLFPNFDSTAAENKGQIALRGDPKITKTSLVFLVVLEQRLSIELSSVEVWEFSRLMADMLLETKLYEQYVSFMATFTDTTPTELLLEQAGRLRYLWVVRGRTSLVAALDEKLLPLFKTRYAKHLSASIGDDKAIFELYDALLFEVGNSSAADQGKIDFAITTCKASLSRVCQLMTSTKSPDLRRVNALAKCVFHFADTQRLYHDRRCIVYGYQLAELLAGVNVPAWSTADAGQKKDLLGTSRTILQTILVSLREAGIELATLRFEDLRALIKLLGEQANYQELELFLASLWRSREVQRNWSPDVVLCIGTLLVHAHFLASHHDRAIALCDTIYYNLRRSHGGLDAQTLEFADRLALLLNIAGRRRDSLRVHEDVLSDLDEHIVALRSAHAKGGHTTDGAVSDERDERLRAAADAHLDGLRRCGWASRGGGHAAMSELYKRLQKYGQLSVQPIEDWAPVNESEEKRNRERAYVGPTSWVLIGADSDKGAKHRRARDSITPAKERWGCWEVAKQVQLAA